MQLSLLVLGFGLVLGASANAGMLNIELGAETLEGVKLAKSATTSVTGTKRDLQFAGAGLRFKKVVLVKAKVYVGELLLASPTSFQRTESGALSSLDGQAAFAMRLTFLRSVDAAKVQSSFQDAFEENNVDLKITSIQAFLEAVKGGGEAKEGRTLTFLAERGNSGKETIYYEDSNQKIVPISGDAGFAKSVFSIWLGKMADSGLENLKSGILTGKH